MSKVTEPGIYDIPAADYHADPCPTASLSSSIGKIMDDKSPLHAWAAHPRLNPDCEENTATAFDLGAAAHALILGSDDGLMVIDPEKFPAKNGNIPKGYTNDAIREARDAAYASGLIPLLPEQLAAVERIEVAARKAMAANAELAGWELAGKPERVLAWREGNIWCRARMDWKPDDPKGVYLDVKTTETSVNPEIIGRYAMNMGWDFQEAFYRRGLQVLGIAEHPRFRFVAIEQSAPHAVTVVGIPPEVAAHADHKVDMMIQLWAECMATGNWPGYPNRTVWLEAPPWSFQRHQERWERPEPMFKPKPPTQAQLRAGEAAQAPRGQNK